MSEAIELLKEFHNRQKREIAKAIVEAQKDILSYKLSKSSHIFKRDKDALIKSFKDDISKKEEQLFKRIKEILNFKNSVFLMPSTNLEYELFSKESYEIFGLSKERLLLVSTLTSATAGGLIDLSVGGHSFFLGTIIGGAVGYFGASYGYEELTKVKVLSNQLIEIGPIEDLNFGFILLNRAINFANSMLNRPHANREEKSIRPVDESASTTKLKKIGSIHKKFRDSKESNKDIDTFEEIILELL